MKPQVRGHGRPIPAVRACTCSSIPEDAMTNFLLSEGDAIEFLDALPDESIDLAITDPPYESLEKHRAKGTTTRLKHSDASSNDWFSIFPNSRFPELFSQLYRVLKPDTHLYLFCDQETMFVVKPIGEAAGFRFWKPLVWDKVSIGMGYHYRCRYEFVLFFEKGKRKLNDLGIADVLTAKRVAQWRCKKCENQRSTRRDIDRSSSTEDGELSTSSNGNESAGRSRSDFSSTTRTKTSSTTGSTTSNSSTRQPTSGSTLDANSETESGGSRVGSAKSSSRSPSSTGTSTLTVDGQSSEHAGHATSQPSSSERSDAAAQSRCPRCGGPRSRTWPTEKPPEIAETLIAQSTVEGQLVVDPFMGSGSTGVAAARRGRHFAGNDLSPKSLELARRRLTECGAVESYALPDGVPQLGLFEQGRQSDAVESEDGNDPTGDVAAEALAGDAAPEEPEDAFAP